jgi:hypothetical protein
LQYDSKIPNCKHFETWHKTLETMEDFRSLELVNNIGGQVVSCHSSFCLLAKKRNTCIFSYLITLSVLRIQVNLNRGLGWPNNKGIGIPNLTTEEEKRKLQPKSFFAPPSISKAFACFPARSAQGLAPSQPESSPQVDASVHLMQLGWSLEILH